MPTYLCAEGGPSTDFAGFVARHAAESDTLHLSIDVLSDGTPTLDIGLHSEDENTAGAAALQTVVRALWAELGATVRDVQGAEPLTEESLQELVALLEESED